jgi:hypothetical protein
MLDVGARTAISQHIVLVSLRSSATEKEVLGRRDWIVQAEQAQALVSSFTL